MRRFGALLAGGGAAQLRRATLSLYRAQLRTARHYDAHPELKPLTGLRGLRSELLEEDDGGGGGGGALPWAVRVARAAEQFRLAFLRLGDADDAGAGGARAHYAPPRSLAGFVRLAYRQSASGLVAPGSAAGLELEAPASAGSVGGAAEVALDAAFALQRQLKQGADLFTVLGADEGGGAGGRTALPDLSALVPGAIVEAASLAPGVLLAEHPTGAGGGGGGGGGSGGSGGSGGGGHNALVLVYDISRNVPELHGDNRWTVRGYVVNRPFPRSVAEVLRGSSEGGGGGGGGGGGEALGAFGRLTLFHGGMDAATEGRLSVLHRFGEIEGAAAVNEDAGSPLFVGGSVPAINAMLDSGRARPEDFKVVLGGWSSQLSSSRDAGGDAGGEEDLSWPDAPLWLQAEGAGAAELALLPAQFDTQGRFRDGAGLAPGAEVEGYNYGRFWHQNAAWAHCVRGVGAAAVAAAEAAGDEAGAARGAEVASWARLHAAVVGYARAVGRESRPTRFLELFEEETSRGDGGASSDEGGSAPDGAAATGGAVGVVR